MTKKYYAVRVGKVPGIYVTWDDCKRMVNGYPGAKYKSFSSITEAEAFLEDVTCEATAAQKENSDKKEIYAFVDGSYNEVTKVYGYGGFLIVSGEKYILQGSGDEEEYSHIEIPNIKIPKIEIPKIEIPSIGFSKLVTKTHKKFVEEDAANDEVTNESSVIAKEEEQVETELVVENSDGIIDSLFVQQDISEVDEVEPTKSEHSVDPDDFALYKKYLS